MVKTYTTSTIAQNLAFQDPAHDAEYLVRDFDGYQLEARALYNERHDKPWVLSIHGARGDYTKSNPISFGLQSRGISLLGMVLSGHSKASPLQPHQTTLQQNIDEVEAFFHDLDPQKQAVIMGFSLGGTPALKLLENHADKIAKIILFYPGLYAKQSYDKPYGEAFRSVISEPYSYRDTDTINLLRKFPGKVLLVKGQYDGLDPVEYGKPAGTSAGEIEVGGVKYYSPIPKEVIDMVQQAVPAERRSSIEIPQCDHSVMLWMRNHPEESRALLDQLAAFITAS